ncbi:MAG TPA: ABC transporter substrate-binding protein [Anaerolineae bacterium]|nr:ABC transporter substrate-binding protein [Anaerolineae bacterium]
MERTPRVTLSLFLFVALSLFLSACALTQPVIKIGLVAPFEGRFRAIGYEAVYAARLAIREINARGGVNGYRIELVALDDRGEAERAIEAARQLVIDPQVVAVIGHYRPTTSAAALAVYCASRVPVVAIETSRAPADCQGVGLFIGRAPDERWGADRLTFVSNVPDPNALPPAADFVQKYNAIPIDGTRAGPIALQTYDVMSLVFDAFERAEKIDRSGVAAVLARSQFAGLGNKYAFDQAGDLIEGITYVYEYDVRGQPRLLTP